MITSLNEEWIALAEQENPKCSSYKQEVSPITKSENKGLCNPCADEEHDTAPDDAWDN